MEITMSEAQEAWRLWHLLQQFSDALWNRYESAFMDFCGEEMERNGSFAPYGKDDTDNEPPF